jgi:hypothetical protein
MHGFECINLIILWMWNVMGNLWISSDIQVHAFLGEENMTWNSNGNMHQKSQDNCKILMRF